MVSDKLAAILRSKTSISPETIAGMSEAEGWRAVYAGHVHKAPKGPTICLTGFSQQERNEWARLGEVRGIKIVESVNKGLLFLCAGETPGPAGNSRN